MSDLKIPSRMAGLPRDKHGYVVPWFVAWIDGKPDFRMIREDGIHDAITYSTCWLCGKPMGRFFAFVIGPMCAVNRVSAEPGSHLDCALYAARACPFLSTPHMKRRDIPDWTPPGGVAIKRNPGVALVWVSRDWKLFPDGLGNYLIDIGDPTSVYWFAEGRTATRAEILASLDSGMPLLRDTARQDPDPAGALENLETCYHAALDLLPGEACAP